jgi:hypothetical protein
VSVFRPAARVTDPEGREWELYAFRIQLPRRRREVPAFDPDGLPDPRAQLAGGLLDGVLWFVGGLLRLLELVLWDAPRAGLHALGSDEWTIEAVTWQPRRTAYTWRTTQEYRGHVLAQVEGQLARGEVPSPGHATYLGGSR